MWPFRRRATEFDLDAKMDELGQSLIDSLGVTGAEQLHDILTRSYKDRAELIGCSTPAKTAMARREAH